MTRGPAAEAGNGAPASPAADGSVGRGVQAPGPWVEPVSLPGATSRGHLPYTLIGLSK